MPRRWTSDRIERLLRDPAVRARCGDDIVLVATKDTLDAYPRAHLPGRLEIWIEVERVPFTRKAMETARRGLAAAYSGHGVPFVYLGPSEARLALYDATTHRLGPWLWSYTEN
jgi:hypothetical protein